MTPETNQQKTARGLQRGLTHVGAESPSVVPGQRVKGDSELSWPKIIRGNGYLLCNIMLALVPWSVATYLRGGHQLTLSLLFMLFWSTGLGYLLLHATGLTKTRPLLALSFAPGVGVVVQSGLFYLSIRTGQGTLALSILMALAATSGGFLLIREFRKRSHEASQAGVYVLLSTAVCLMFYTVALCFEYRVTEDGSFEFLLEDTQLNTSIAVDIKNGMRPAFASHAPSLIGYHYGRYAIAGLFSRYAGVEITTCVLALTGLGLCILFTSALGFSRLVCECFDRQFPWGPCIGAFALFFAADIHEQTRSAAYTILNHLGIDFTQTNDLMFSSGNTGHYFYGHSIPWAVAGLLSVFGVICALWSDRRTQLTNLVLLLAAGPCLITLNLMAGLATAGTLILLLLLRCKLCSRLWVFVAILTLVNLCSVLFIAGGGTSGVSTLADSPLSLYTQSPGRVIALLSQYCGQYFWLIPGLGIGLVGVAHMLRHRNQLLFQMVLILFTGGLMSMILVKLGWGNERYIMIFAFHCSSLVAAIMIGQAFRDFVRYGKTSLLDIIIRDWCSITVTLALLVYVTQLAGALIALKLGRPLDNAALRLTVPLIMAAIAYVGHKYATGSNKVKLVATFTLLVVFTLQVKTTVAAAYAWHTAAARPAHMVIKSGEVQGLRQLRRVSRPDDLCVTNRNLNTHQANSSHCPIDWQAQYKLLSERQFLIEQPYVGARVGPSAHRHDNRTVFESQDLDAVRDVLNRHDIRYIVCVPGTDLRLPGHSVGGLERMPRTGTLTIYRVLKPTDDPSGHRKKSG